MWYCTSLYIYVGIWKSISVWMVMTSGMCMYIIILCAQRLLPSWLTKYTCMFLEHISGWVGCTWILMILQGRSFTTKCKSYWCVHTCTALDDWSWTCMYIVHVHVYLITCNWICNSGIDGEESFLYTKTCFLISRTSYFMYTCQVTCDAPILSFHVCTGVL